MMMSRVVPSLALILASYTAQSNQRVTASPITVKGLKTGGAGRSDVVISNADAQLIRASSENASFMKKCRVMIVLD